jgi:hypothetical protein
MRPRTLDNALWQVVQVLKVVHAKLKENPCGHKSWVSEGYLVKCPICLIEHTLDQVKEFAQ